MTNASDLSHDIILSYDSPNNEHTITRDKYGCNNDKLGYCSRIHEGIRCYRKSMFYWYECSINKIVCYCHEYIIFKSELRTWFIEHQCFMDICWIDWRFWLPSIHYFTCWIIIFLIFSFLYEYHYVTILLYTLLENILLTCGYCLFELMWLHPLFLTVILTYKMDFIFFFAHKLVHWVD